MVSSDIKVLLCQWASRRRFVLPDGGFFPNLRTEFSKLMRSVFPGFICVSERELTEGLRSKTALLQEPLLSLERAYLDTPLRLELCRCVNKQNTDIGLYRRNGTRHLREQLADLRNAGVQSVVLVDDVIYSGDSLLRVLDMLKAVGINVSAIYAGIAIGEGVEKIRSLGYSIECVRFFPKVIDEVCERDFFPGVPFSGLTLQGVDNVGVPYILPFGLIGRWASVPREREKHVSERCLELTMLLFNEIGRVSGHPVLCSDLGRGILGIPPSEKAFVAELQRVIT